MDEGLGASVDSGGGESMDAGAVSDFPATESMDAGCLLPQ